MQTTNILFLAKHCFVETVQIEHQYAGFMLENPTNPDIVEFQIVSSVVMCPQWTVNEVRRRILSLLHNEVEASSAFDSF